MKRFRILISAFVAVLLSFSAFAQTPKYVFLFIGDGMGFNQVYATHMYNEAFGAEDVNFFGFPEFRLVTSFSASSLVTDSSAAGTALASGVKTGNGMLGVYPDKTPVVTISELAKSKGFAAGVVTSVGINHATPASFYGKAESRNMYDLISGQLIESDLDFAAGAAFLVKDKDKYSNAYWIDEAKKAGITVFEGKNAYKPTKGRVIYLENVGEESLAYAIDRKEGRVALADFTAAAIDHLYAASKKGFFLMVEGGKIDYACHATDAATAVKEVNDMAESVQLALDFAAKHPKETLIIVTADHETGGLTIGAGKYEFSPKYLECQKCSKDVLTAHLNALAKQEEIVSWGSVKEVLRQDLGFWDSVKLSPRFEKQLTQLYKETYLDGLNDEEKNLYSSNAKLASAAVEYLDGHRAQAKYSFGSHSGTPVPMWAYGASAVSFRDCKDNTDIFNTIVKVARYK